MAAKVDLIIATPGNGVTTGYLQSLLATAAKLSELGISWTFSQQYSSHVADAREITINGSRENDPKDQRVLRGEVEYKKILWIDSDITFTPEDVIKAYESPYDIVSGAYLLATGEVVAYREMLKPAMKFDEVKEMTEPIQIAGAGMGFMAVKAGVFESLSRPWFQSPLITIKYNGEDMTFPIMGEDLSFCHRAKGAGFEIWLDPSIKLIHQKTMQLTWNGIMP